MKKKIEKCEIVLIVGRIGGNVFAGCAVANAELWQASEGIKIYTSEYFIFEC